MIVAVSTPNANAASDAVPNCCPRMNHTLDVRLFLLCSFFVAQRQFSGV
jgi:hypothetical protein